MNIDIFQNDAFALRSLTESINKIPPRFSYLGQVPGLFQERGISTTTTEIEEREGRLSLVPASVRGTRGEAIPRALRKMRPFKAAHLQFNDEILADDVLNIRQFGSTDQLRPVLDLVAEKLQTAADSMEITLEYMRLGAVKGVVYDANGNILNDMFEEFDQKQRKQTWTIPATNTGYLKQRC
ncbi:MAG: major capsid protein, partial [Planctomycetia bacterium]|nr:major capsid protein [Planctomycetia bacterium]